MAVLFKIGPNEIHGDPDVTGSVTPTEVVCRVQDAVTATQARIKAIREDTRLSEVARLADIERVGDELLVEQLKAKRKLDAMETGIRSRVAQALAPPKLEAGDAVSFLADQERRGWLRSLPSTKRYEMLGAMHRGEADELALAILRSPTPAPPEDVQIARERWEARQRAANPQFFEKTDLGLRSYEWGIRVLAHQEGFVHSMTKPDERRMKRIVEGIKD